MTFLQKIFTNFLIVTTLVFLFVTPVKAEMMLFVGDGCAFCKNLEDYMAQYDIYDKFGVKRYEIYFNEENRYLYAKTAMELGYKTGKIPFLVNGSTYVDGDKKIIAYFQQLLGSNKVEPTILAETESLQLNQILQDDVKNSDESDKIKLIGIIVIIFGVTLSLQIIRRARNSRRRRPFP